MRGISKSKKLAAKGPLSRRTFLEKSFIGAALAGTAILPAWAPLNRPSVEDDLLHEVKGKVSKKSARYQDQPNGDQQCSRCTHFRGGTCEIVEGRISPNGWCRHFKKKGASKGKSSKSSSGGSQSGGGGSKSSGGGGSGY